MLTRALLPASREAGGRSAEADLIFAAGGGRTVLTRQHVPYPFHVTRTFRLDRDQPDVATLYLQSASGGLYRGDDLGLSITVRPGARAHVTTQAATMVHDTGAVPARQRTTLHVMAGGLLAYTPDPLVLFPGAALVGEARLVVAPSARAIVADGFTWHDPQGSRRPFDVLRQGTEIVDGNGRCLVCERGLLSGADVLSEASPLGPFQALGSIFILGPAEGLPSAERLQSACDAAGCLSAATTLPNGAGRLVRCLAPDGGALRKGLEAGFAVAFTALIGTAPAVRRK